MKWVLLFSAILLEVCGTTSMKLAKGFSQVGPSISMFAFYATSLVVLTFVLKQIPVGIAYAIWSALGIVLVSVIDVVFFKESMSLLQVLSLCVIVVGVISLNVSTIRPDVHLLHHMQMDGHSEVTR